MVNSQTIGTVGDVGREWKQEITFVPTQCTEESFSTTTLNEKELSQLIS